MKENVFFKQRTVYPPVLVHALQFDLLITFVLTLTMFSNITQEKIGWAT